MRRISAISLLLLFTITTVSAKIIVYPSSGCDKNTDYTIKIRQVGNSDWIDLFSYNVKVDLNSKSNASMVQFDFSGKIEIMIKKNSETLNTVTIRPLNRNIKPAIHDNTIYFQIDSPTKLSIECNGDRLHNLHVFANACEEEAYTENDPNVIYFGAGLHKPEKGTDFIIPSNKIVYIAPGAVLKGRLLCNKVTNVKILGRGIVMSPAQGISITFSTSISISGITFINPIHYTVYGGQSSKIDINNIKSFSCEKWSDGIDVMSCSDMTIKDVFLRNSDDCIAVYGHRGAFYGDVHNIAVKNSILWADKAHPINIGVHGEDDKEKNIIENLTFHNIDILEQKESLVAAQGCMAITCGDNNLIRNVLFEKIRVDDFTLGQLFNLRVTLSKVYNKKPGYGIENVTFRNITYNGKNRNPSQLGGYDENRILKKVRFKNITINGKKIKSLKEMNVQINSFVKDIKIK